jgi:tripartite-type tricarboxylate transporter receptor subunit TctC
LFEAGHTEKSQGMILMRMFFLHKVNLGQLRIQIARLALASLVMVVLTFWPGAHPLQAQGAFPNRSIRIVVPYTPGALTDITSRAVGAELSKILGQSVVIENKPGGGTAIGTVAVKNSPADGYTILYQSDPMITNLYLMKQPGYVLADFKPVAGLSESAFVMVVTTKRPFNSLKDLVEYGKANPGKLLYATTGLGSPSSILSAKLGQAAKMDWVEVPHKGGAEATQATMTGVTDAFMISQGAPLLQGKPDTLKLFAISSSERSDFFPDLPTFKELGYPSAEFESWAAFFVRSDTPADITAKLKAALASAMNSPSLIEQMKKLGIPGYRSNLEDLPGKLEKQTRDFADEAKKLGLEPQ